MRANVLVQLVSILLKPISAGMNGIVTLGILIVENEHIRLDSTLEQPQIDSLSWFPPGLHFIILPKSTGHAACAGERQENWRKQSDSDDSRFHANWQRKYHSAADKASSQA